jgi:hypothetical protein
MSTTTEADEFGAFVRRVLRAYSRRVADRDVAGLTGLAQLAADVDAATADAVAQLVAGGYSWADIGTALGITRQGAFQRYGKARKNR